MLITRKLLVIAWICAAATHVRAGRGTNSIEAVNTYTTTDNGRTATRDRSGVREKKLSQGEGEDEEGVRGRTANDDPVFCVKGIDEGKRPSAAAMYGKENDTGAKVCGNAAGG